MIASYLQTALNLYKTEGKLPDWAVNFRKILDRLDEPCDGSEFMTKKPSDAEPSPIYDFFNDQDLKEDQKPASMSFLQIKPFQENGQMYDFRDEHEYKMSKNPATDLRDKYEDDIDIEFINVMNSSRESEGKLFGDLSRAEQELFENTNETTGDFSKESSTFGKRKTEETFKDLGAKVDEINTKTEK